MIDINLFISQFNLRFTEHKQALPWQFIYSVQHIVHEKLKTLTNNYNIKNDVAIHKTATIEEHVVMKGPIIISENCFVGAHAYLRSGVYLSEKVSVGPGCEIKSSVLFPNSALAHFNFVGDSILGSFVNLEAGSIIANHFNERNDKRIVVKVNDVFIDTGVTKFGALVGDYTKIGANGVLSPGTILPTKSIVKRLELIEQH